MDTIFVKQVKEGGPAHGAGLCTGKGRQLTKMYERLILNAQTQSCKREGKTKLPLNCCTDNDDVRVLQAKGQIARQALFFS